MIEIPPEVDATWMMAALLLNKEDKINILQLTMNCPLNLTWTEHCGHYSNSTRRYRKGSDRVPVGGYVALKIYVEGKNLERFKRSRKDHTRVVSDARKRKRM